MISDLNRPMMVSARADAAHRGLDTRLEESFRVTDREVLHAAISHRSLAALAWQHHRNVSAYEAFYVAAARARGLPLLTADGRLARASGRGA